MDIIQLNINEKPTSIEQFKGWFNQKFNYSPAQYEGYYQMCTTKLRETFINSPFWKAVSRELPNINDKYQIEKGYQLLTTTDVPEICIKSLDSLIIKAYRKNILNNTFFPDQPKNGWISHQNWFTKINDILRTTIVVKYIDGVEFLLKELSIIADQNSCKLNYSLEAREEGYYAAHAGVKIKLKIFNTSFLQDDIELNVEIQVTTELQEIIKILLHKHYEENRKKITPPNYKWQWDYKCDEFASNYLGHIVHYVEGMIVEIRDKQNRK